MATNAERPSTELYPEQPIFLARAEMEPTRIAQANRPANLPTGYKPYPEYTVKITPQGAQFVQDWDDRIHENHTYPPQEGVFAVDDQDNNIDIAVQSPNGQIRIIPAGTPLTVNNLQDGDRLYFPPERQQTQQPPTPQPATAVDQFRLALQSNALNQLSLSRDRLTTELAQYQTLDTSAWEHLRQVAAKDEQLQNFQIKAVDTFTEFVEANIIHGRVIWPGTGFSFPANEGNLAARREAIVQYLESNPAWKAELEQNRGQFNQLLNQVDLADQIEILRTQLEQQYPALAALGSEQIAALSNQELHGKLSEQFGQAIQDIDKLSQRIQENPNRALQLDLSVARTLEQFADNPQVIDWVKAERTKDGLISGAGTAATALLAVGSIIVFKHPGLATALGLGAGAVGGATALYELPQLEDIDAAAQASLGGGELTSTARETARRDLWLGRANVVLAGVDLGLPVIVRVAPQTMAVLKRLNPEQGTQLLQAAQAKLAGNLSEAQRLLQQVKGQVRDSDLIQQLDELINQISPNPQLAAEGAPISNRPLESRTQPGSGGQIAQSGAETVAAQVQRLEQALVTRGVLPARASKMMQIASENPKILNAIEGLLNGRGNLRNPDALPKLVEKMVVLQM